MKREKITATGSTMDMIVEMSEGNPGAATVIGSLLQENPMESMMALLDLDDMNIRGSQIWVAYKDCCGQDLNLLKKKIKSRDNDMVDKINKECMYGDNVEKAVTSGASYNR